MRHVDGVQLVELGEAVLGYLRDAVVRCIQHTQTGHILNGYLSREEYPLISSGKYNLNNSYMRKIGQAIVT